MQKRLRHKGTSRFLKPHTESLSFKFEKAQKQGQKVRYIAVKKRLADASPNAGT